MINFYSGENLNFNNLLDLKHSNKIIIRTAHPGNFDPVTIFIAKYFSTLLREDISSGADIYKPELLIKQKNTISLCANENHTNVVFLSACKEVDFPNPLCFHYQSLLKLFPEIERGVEAIKEGENIASVLRIISNFKPAEFKKYYNAKGEEFKLSEVLEHRCGYKRGDSVIFIEKNKLYDLYKNHVKRVTEAYKGEFLEKMESVDISNTLFHVLLICSKFGPDCEEDMYHLCGSRMYDYLYKDSRFASLHQNEINELFDIIKKHLNLVYNINFFLVPTQQFRTFLSYKKIDGDVDAYSIHQLINELKIYLINKNTINQIELDRKNKIIDLLISEDILTQYDLLESVSLLSRIGLDDKFLNTSFLELNSLNKSNISYLNRIKKYGLNITKL